MSTKGTIERRGHRYRVRVFDEGERISLGSFDTRAEAQAQLEAYAELKIAGRVKGVSLKSYGETWFDRREERGLVRGVRAERSKWRSHVATADFANAPLRRLTRKQVVRWVSRLMVTEATAAIRHKVDGEWTTKRRPTDRRLARKTVLDCLTILRLVLRDAYDEGLVAHNPAEGVRVPRSAPRPSVAVFLRPDEIETMLRARKPEERHRLAWTVAIYTGLRLSELLALRWGDVELEDRPRVTVRTGKSERSRREVPLLPPALRALRRWRELAPGLPSALVWSRPRGVAHHAQYDFRWRYWSAQLLGRHVRFHDLRHTCCSHLVQGTWGRALTLYEVRDWAGHSSVIVTQRYAHLSPDGIHGLARLMSDDWAVESDESKGDEL